MSGHDKQMHDLERRHHEAFSKSGALDKLREMVRDPACQFVVHEPAGTELVVAMKEAFAAPGMTPATDTRIALDVARTLLVSALGFYPDDLVAQVEAFLVTSYDVIEKDDAERREFYQAEGRVAAAVPGLIDKASRDREASKLLNLAAEMLNLYVGESLYLGKPEKAHAPAEVLAMIEAYLAPPPPGDEAEGAKL